MNKNIDLLVYEFRHRITEETNNSPLPMSVKAMIIKELYDAVISVAEKQLNQELMRNGIKLNEEDKEKESTEV